MNIIFVDGSNTKVKSVSTGFNWILLFFSGILGIPCFIKGLIGEGIFCLIFYIISVMGFSMAHSGRELGLVLMGFTTIIMLFYSIYLGFYGNRMVAYRLIKKGYFIKDGNNPIVRNQLYKWKVGDSVIRPINNDSNESPKSENKLDELRKLGDLLKDGIITQEEFDSNKSDILKECNI